MKRRSWFRASFKFALTISLSMALEFSCTRIVQNELTDNRAWFKPHYVTVVDTVEALPDTVLLAATDTTTITIVDTLVVVSTLAALPETVHVFSDTLTVVKVMTVPPIIAPPETVVVRDTVTVQAPLDLPPRPWKSTGRPDGVKTP